MRRCQTDVVPVLAARSPGLGNVDNLHQVCTCNFIEFFFEYLVKYLNCHIMKFILTNCFSWACAVEFKLV